jgi:hypothetical protein
MGRNRLIYDVRNLETASEEMLKKIDRAVLAAAFKIRDEMRDEFRKSQSSYKYNTSDYQRLAGGIMVGKLNDSHVKVHSLGNKTDDGTWKARFFVGGTTYRKNNRGNKGFIKSNEAVDKGLSNAETILNTFIKNTLEN